LEDDRFQNGGVSGNSHRNGKEEMKWPLISKNKLLD